MSNKRQILRLQTRITGEYAHKAKTIIAAKDMNQSEFLKECIRYTIENRYGFKPPITR
jgi:hypothetical protein